MEIERRKYTKAYISIAPMIDVVFLLLLFFMLTSNLIREPAIKIQLPEADSAQATHKEHLTITVTEDKEVFLEDKPVDINELEDVLRSYGAHQLLKPVHIKTDRKTHVGRLIRVVDAVKLAGIKSFNIITKQGRKQKR